MPNLYLKNKFCLTTFLQHRTSSCIYKCFLVISMATLTGLAAQIKFYLPWSPVPVTGQTFIVLLSGIFLGKNLGGISQAIYLILGLIGIPWFQGGNSGIHYLLGPTGGYLIGFVFEALFIGYTINFFTKSKHFLPILLILIIANFGIMFPIGLVYLYIYLSYTTQVTHSFISLLQIGLLPFIIGDTLKIILTATIARFNISRYF